MRVRSGIDMVSVDRIRKNVANEDGAFMRKCYTEGEISRINTSSSSIAKRAESFAACFAAKEAASKALGTGIMTKGIGLTDFEVVKDNAGAPSIRFLGEARETAERLKVISSSLSLTHEKGYAAAVCVLLTDEENG